LEKIEERFAVDGEPCTAEELVALVDRLRPVALAMDDEAHRDGDPTGGPTYFELTTAMALLHFVERRVDAAILEVGLGGRLDSTNVCLPAVSVITSISFDHMRQLGNTLGKIAREKAGIIKPGVPVVCGVTDEEPQTVIAEIAREHGCRLIQRDRDFHFQYHPAQRAGARAPSPADGRPPVDTRQGDKETRRQGEGSLVSLSPCLPVSFSMAAPSSIDFSYSLSGEELQLHELPLAMRGPHQAANAAVALATIAELRHQGWCVSTDAMRLGLARATLPGRAELIPGDPVIVLDTAHNAASARALVEMVSELPKPSCRTVVLSISRDKDVRAIAQELVSHFDRFVMTQYRENPRAMPADSLSAIVQELLAGRAAELTTWPIPADAWHYVLQTVVPGEVVCITGSFFLAAELHPLACGRREERRA
jgi:dihydrofolate synthase/folylpolyglutamate synthase